MEICGVPSLPGLLSLTVSFHHRGIGQDRQEPQDRQEISMSTLTPSLPTHKPGHASLSVLAFAASIALLYYGRIFFITMVIAVIIAFLLDPVVTAFMKMRLPRAVASFIVCSIALLALYLLGFFLYTQFSGFVEELPIYSQRMNDMVDSVATQMDQIEKKTYQMVVPKRFQDQQQLPGPTPAET